MKISALLRIWSAINSSPVNIWSSATLARNAGGKFQDENLSTFEDLVGNKSIAR